MRREIAGLLLLAWFAIGAAAFVATRDPDFRAGRVHVRNGGPEDMDAHQLRVRFAVDGARRVVPPGVVTATSTSTSTSTNRRVRIEMPLANPRGERLFARARGGARIEEAGLAVVVATLPADPQASVEVRNYRTGGGYPAVWIVPGDGLLGVRIVCDRLLVPLIFLGLPLAALAARAAWRRGGAPLAFVVALGVYLANGERLGELDAKPAPHVAIRILRDGALDLDLDELRVFDWARPEIVVAGADGRAYTKVPPGNVLAALPFFALPVWIGGLEPASPAVDALAKLAAATATALAAALVFAAAARRTGPRPAWFAFAAFAFGTTAFSAAAQDLWAHGAALLGIALVAHALVEGPPRPGPAVFALRNAVLAGVGSGLAGLARPIDGVIGLLAIAICARRGGLRAAAAVIAGALPFAVLLAGWNHVCFGAPWRTGYGAEAHAFTGPFLEGLAGLLVAPSRGLFIYSPVLLIALPGLARVIARAVARPGDRELPPDEGARALAVLALFPLAITLATAKWHTWVGGWSYGPRLLTSACPILALLVAEAWPRLGPDLAARLRHAAACLLLAVSAGIHALHAFAGSNDWSFRHQDELPRAVWSLEDTQIGDSLRRVFGQPGRVLWQNSRSRAYTEMP